ncbi:MAG: MBL fold metallo-hydrolase [Flavobacteriales bacterium]|nr:MBL fold metallo-hydrolase [Flavobacteriales bacterium]
MELLKSDFTFFKVGQGAFYGGQIFSPDSGKAWNIVYDCGTSTWIKGHYHALDREIIHFTHNQFIPVNKIDILFISHLDYDHVSGVVKLLKRHQAKKIVIPYFPKNQRYVLRFSAKEFPNGEDDFGIDDYDSFIENPYSFLRERYKDADIYIVTSEEAKYIEDLINPEGDELSAQGTPATPPADEFETTAAEFQFFKNNLQFFLRNRWEFSTYVKEITAAQVRGLKLCLLLQVGKTKDDELEDGDYEKLIAEKRKEAHACYKKKLDDINAHGMVLLHGPVNYHRIAGRSYVESEIRPPHYRARRRHAWADHYGRLPHAHSLLMGDTSIKPGNNPVAFREDFRRKLESVIVFQVPHHGSSKNWDMTQYENLPTRGWMHRYLTNVCNFGYGNKYGHPSHEVLNDLGDSLVLNSQFTSFSTGLKVYYR